MATYRKARANFHNSQGQKLLFLLVYANNWRDGRRRRNMAARDTLIFTGRRWPGVQSVGGLRSGRSFYLFTFRASGDGQQWDTDRPLMFWRSFIEIDLSHTGEALHFVARHGDPFGQLDQERARLYPPPFGTNRLWPDLGATFGKIAQAWEPLDPNGISFISDNPERLEVAQRALRELAPPGPHEKGLEDIEWIAQGRGLVPRARTLRAFMIASAASALRRGVAMKKCAYCGDWFELRRTDAFYCSGSCQAADYKQRAMAQGTTVLEIASRKRKGRPHGERS